MIGVTLWILLKIWRFSVFRIEGKTDIIVYVLNTVGKTRFLSSGTFFCLFFGTWKRFFLTFFSKKVKFFFGTCQCKNGNCSEKKVKKHDFFVIYWLLKTDLFCFCRVLKFWAFLLSKKYEKKWFSFPNLTVRVHTTLRKSPRELLGHTLLNNISK